MELQSIYINYHQKLTATQINLYILWSTWRSKLSPVNKHPKRTDFTSKLGNKRRVWKVQSEEQPGGWDGKALHQLLWPPLAHWAFQRRVDGWRDPCRQLLHEEELRRDIGPTVVLSHTFTAVADSGWVGQPLFIKMNDIFFVIFWQKHLCINQSLCCLLRLHI